MDAPTYRELRERFDEAVERAVTEYAEGNLDGSMSQWDQVKIIANTLILVIGREKDEHSRR